MYAATILPVLLGIDDTHKLPATGFGDRLLHEVKKMAPKDVKIKV